MAELIVALDFDCPQDALACVRELKNDVTWFKVGMELFDLAGPQIIAQLKDEGAKLFLDLKLHDIPQTVERTAKVLTKLGVDMFNVHAQGGSAMLAAARRGALAGAEEEKLTPPLLVGVTVLTSLDDAGLSELGIDADPQEQVLRLARLCQSSGLDGVVCSAQEAENLKRELGEDFVLVTPGIRPQESSVGDQKRVATPKNAVLWGADYLVVGRPITQAADPKAAASKILREMGEV